MTVQADRRRSVLGEWKVSTNANERPTKRRDAMMETIAKEMGFDSAADMNGCIAAVDIGTPEKLAAFKTWQTEDGTKAGLRSLRMQNDGVTEEDLHDPLTWPNN